MKITPPLINWACRDAKYYQADMTNSQAKLPVGIFNVEVDAFGQVYLSLMQEKFDFPKPLYGCETKFINKVVKTYQSTNKNLGICLVGLKGSGKSVTAKLIADKLNLPVITINNDLGPKLLEFLKNIQQDVVLFFDEFEKVFKSDGKPTFDSDGDLVPSGAGSSMLTLMDGAIPNLIGRKVFILTANNDSIHDAMKDRPSRIRYLKKFGSLSTATVEEILEDRLVDKTKMLEVRGYIEKVKNITLDTVFSAVEEVNIHGVLPEDFNVSFSLNKILYRVYRDEKGMVTSQKKVQIIASSFSLDVYEIGHSIYAGSHHLGNIVAINKLMGTFKTTVDCLAEEKDDGRLGISPLTPTRRRKKPTGDAPSFEYCIEEELDYRRFGTF